MSKGGGNAGLWKARKTIKPFSALPANLGNHNDDFHIPSASATATANLNQSKGAFRSTATSDPFRLILRLEKTLYKCPYSRRDRPRLC
jgi:hypothetical protein